jgi:hypothetical protein
MSAADDESGIFRAGSPSAVDQAHDLTQLYSVELPAEARSRFGAAGKDRFDA